MKLQVITLLTIVAAITSCKSKQSNFDASGAFEAEETILYAETSGIIKQFNVEEGQALQAGQQVGYIDSLQLYLRRKQLQSQIKTTLSARPDIPTQLAALQVQLKTAEREKQRVTNLAKANVGTQK